ncbi:MAG: LemA family protein, partial [Patescibacteria group bacterium]
MSTTWWIIIGIAGVLVLWLIGVFNALIRLKNRTEEAWSDIDVQLKRRYDLIPNLIEAVKGYV